MEKRPRLEINLNENEKEEDEINEDLISEDSESVNSDITIDSEEERQLFIRSLIPETPVDGEPSLKKKIFFDDDNDNNNEDGDIVDNQYSHETGALSDFLLFPWRLFLRWRERERARRMHYIFVEYEAIIKIHDEMLKKKLKDEIEADERAVKLEAYRSKQRKIRNSVTKDDSKVSLMNYTLDIDRRDREADKMAYYCYNLQRWAGERGDEKDDNDVSQAKAREIQAVKDGYDKKISDRLRKKKEDNAVMELDVEISQAAMKVMRASGFLEGVNPKASIKQIHDGINEQSDIQEINLNKNVDWSKKRSTKSTMEHLQQLPFDVDLQVVARSSRVLKAHLIGDRGALSLGAEIIRGACPIVEEIDLKGCEVTCRGFGRLLHGVRFGNLRTVRVLKLRGNFIQAKGLRFLQYSMQGNVFDALYFIDLRDNELGDQGADVFIHMVIQGLFRNITHVLMQRNNITDEGFGKIIRVMQSMGVAKCPNLQRLGLEGNNISAHVKNKFRPFPFYISI